MSSHISISPPRTLALFQGDVHCVRETAKKFFLVARLVRGGGGKGRSSRNKSEKNVARGWGAGGKALVAGPIKKNVFAASLRKRAILYFQEVLPISIYTSLHEKKYLKKIQSVHYIVSHFDTENSIQFGHNTMEAWFYSLMDISPKTIINHKVKGCQIYFVKIEAIRLLKVFNKTSWAMV